MEKYDPKVTPWQVSERDFPREGSSTEKLKFLLRYAILAPSSHNSQPWKFHIRDSEIDIFADKDRWLKVADADQRELYISVGCALENLLIAAEHFGYAHQEEYFPEGEDSLVALVKLTPQGKIEKQRDPVLFEQIPKRDTNHNLYETRKIPKAEMAQLHACIYEDGFWIFSTNEGPYILFTEEELRRRIDDNLIPTESAVMGIEENIGFLKTELGAVKLLISSEEERLARLKGRKAGASQTVTNLRATIRDLRSDLLERRDFSVAAIREQIYLQEEITNLEQLRDEFEEQFGRLEDAAERWQENRARYSELPDDYFSEEDKGKLDALSEGFAKNVQRFGYRSTGVTRLHISEDNYRPVCDEFEVAFGASASDNIRLIWAYTLALLQVSSSHGGKHWGVLLFDEPEQQKMKDASLDALYTEIAQMQREDSQVIIATSASVDVTSRRLDNLPHKLLEFGEKVIRPIQQ